MTLAAPAVAPVIGIEVRVRGEADGPVLAAVPVKVEDLRDPISELAWRSGPRRGSPDFSLEESAIRLRAVADADRGEGCRGFLLCAQDAAGQEVSLTCGTAALQPVAQRAAARLREQGLLPQEGTYYYDLARRPDAGEVSIRPEPGTGTASGEVIARKVGVEFARLDLRDLLKRSVAGGEVEEDHHLFYTEAALLRAEAIARRGESQEPAVETGGVLLGLLGCCPSTRDAFVIVVDALEAMDAEQAEFSLSFSSRTWQRLQAVVRARRTEPGQSGLRIVGQTHGHPFSPGEPCAACPATAACPKHTAYLSDHDRLWSRAVFASQAFQVGHMFGIDAKGAPVSSVYGLRGGRLERRGYRTIRGEDLREIHDKALHGDER